MPERINKAIIEHYDTYKRVRYENKIVTVAHLVLEDKSKADSRKGEATIKSVILTDVILMIEASKKHLKRYGFKLMAKSISEKPFFRFDAAGLAHNNNLPTIPLTLRQITTPHFQYYDERGYSTAYKNDALNDAEKVLKMEQDINEGMIVFCQEALIRTASNGFPTIDREPSVLFPLEDVADPLKDIDFDLIA